MRRSVDLAQKPWARREQENCHQEHLERETCPDKWKQKETAARTVF